VNAWESRNNCPLIPFKDGPQELHYGQMIAAPNNRRTIHQTRHESSADL
jgi:hypothetical protein